uniref:Prolyl 4-hydroxylase N-terminal domain-containing protein n=1 Tax=Cacopsylla melanoneura TaxID=428564 RepID=A0A8D8QEN7_9HEMI
MCLNINVRIIVPMALLISFAHPILLKKTQQELKSKADLIKYQKGFLKSIDSYVQTKSMVLNQLEKMTNSWRRKTEESNENSSEYVKNPLNCLKLLTSLVIDLQQFIRELLNEANVGFQYEALLETVDEDDLETVVRDLVADVKQKGWTWEQVQTERSKFDDDDLAQLRKILDIVRDTQTPSPM